MLKNPWAQACLSLLAAGGFFTLAAFLPTAASNLQLVAAAFMGFAMGRPLPAGYASPGPTERNPELPPPAGDK